MNVLEKTRNMVAVAFAAIVAFAAGYAPAVDLPANYTRLDWIESDSANEQWIDSGYHPQSTTVIRASILARQRKGDWSAFWGLTKDNSGDIYAVQLRYYDKSSDFNGIFCNSSYGEARIPAVANGEYQIELNRESLTVIGSQTTTKTINASGTPFDAPLYVFCENNHTTAGDGSDNARRYQPMRLYSMTISEGDTPMRDFIPCIDNNGAYGLWDAVEGVFYGNMGTKADFTGGIIYRAAANEKLTVPNAAGIVELRGEDAATSEIEVGSVAPGTLVYVPNETKRVAIDSVGVGVKIIVRKILGSDAPVTLALPAGQMIDSLTIEEGLTVCLESGSVGSFEGTGSLVVQGAVGYGTISGGIDVSVESNGAMTSLLDDVAATVLGDLPALWLDASDETTLQEYTYNNHTVPEGTFPGIVVRRWNDVRGGGDRYYAVNARSSTGDSDGGYIRTMPYSVTNALNGLTVLSFGTRGGKVYDYQDQINENAYPSGGKDGHDEQRRMIFNQPIASKTVVMVYGSQDGGGKGLIGGWKSGETGESKNPMSGETIAASGQAAYYNRSGTTTTDMVLNRSNVPFWVDGTPVVPNETAALNGAYQILSMGIAPGDSPSVRSLGMDDNYQNAGGQRYGEILVFTNELTTVQRKAVEMYLAKKWGLTAGYSAEASPKSLTVAEGGVFEAVDSALVYPHGAGTLAVGCDLDAGGIFSGNVTVAAGATLVVPPSADVLTEAAVDNIPGRIARFDPDCEDDIEFGESSGMRMVYALFGHGNKAEAGTPYLHGYYRNDDNDRRPVYSRGARGFGPERGWLDLNADPANHTVKGNNLRIKTDHSKARTDSGDIIKQSVKTVFIVMDSCHGGGLPVIDAGAPDGTTAVKARASYTDFTAPIWGSGTSGILTNGETRINGVAVDGTTTGFTGAPELFSFTTDGSVFNAGVFGYWNAGTDKAFEVLGEIVLFNEVLDAETRGGVEAYLMKKWLDTLPPGYVDWTGATIGGAGTVCVAQLKNLPRFDGFTGTLDLAAETLSFTLDGTTKTVAEAIDIGDGALKLAPEGVITLSFKNGRAKSGTYRLATCGSVLDAGLAGWTLPSRTPDEKFEVRFKADEGGLVVEVVPSGMFIILL